MSLSLFLNVCSQFSPGFDVQVFSQSGFSKSFWFANSFWCFKYIRVALFFKMRSKLAFALGGYAFWVLRLWGELRFGLQASKQQAVQQRLGGLAASSLFWFGRERIGMGERVDRKAR